MKDWLDIVGLTLWFLLFVKIVLNEDNKKFTNHAYMLAWTLLTIFPVTWLWTYFHVFLFQAVFGSLAYTKVFLGTAQFGLNFDFWSSWASLIMSTTFFGSLVWWFYHLNNKLKVSVTK